MGERLKNHNGVVPKERSGSYSYDSAQLVVLIDIRDELQALNRLLACPNFIGIPRTLRRISANTAKPRKRKKVKTNG